MARLRERKQLAINCRGNWPYPGPAPPPRTVEKEDTP